MTTPRILWTLALSALLLSSPAAAYDAYGFQFDAGNLSHCYVVNVASYPMVMGCVVQDMTNPGNPVDLGHGVSRLLRPGESQELTYAVRVPLCAKAQIDGLINLQPWQLAIERWTESDIANTRVTALGQYVHLGACAPTPPPPTSTPPPPPVAPQCVNKSFTFGGSPAIARFPEGFVNPWLPLWRGPFYLDIPKHAYHVYAWTYDCHSCKQGEATQDAEIGEFWLETGNGMLIIGPTTDIADDQDYSFSDLGVWDIPDVKLFYAVHAHRGTVSEPTHSFQPLVLYFNSMPHKCERHVDASSPTKAARRIRRRKRWIA